MTMLLQSFFIRPAWDRSVKILRRRIYKFKSSAITKLHVKRFAYVNSYCKTISNYLRSILTSADSTNFYKSPLQALIGTSFGHLFIGLDCSLNLRKRKERGTDFFSLGDRNLNSHRPLVTIISSPKYFGQK
jgi:hypothetical protein